MNKPKVSVIIPVYNVEKYLERCLNSVVNQSLKDIEIIIVNDESPDNSEAIIKAFQEKDKRIKYVKHQKNLGLGLARNTGLNVASGLYILFLDSDDYIDTDMAKTLYHKAKELNLDILEADYFIHQHPSGKTIKRNIKITPEIVTGMQFLNRIDYVLPVVWNKLWRLDFLRQHHLKFKEGYYEDVLFTLKGMSLAQSVFRINKAMYHYILRENSITTKSINPKHLEDTLNLFNQLENLVADIPRGDGFDQIEKTMLTLLGNLRQRLDNFNPKSEEDRLFKKSIQKEYRKKFRQNRHRILKNTKLSLLQKLSLWISPYAYYKISVLKKRIIQ